MKLRFSGYCSDQSVCYIYGEGSWDEGIAICQRLHPNARMIKEMSAEEGSKHIAETGTILYVILVIIVLVISVFNAFD